MDMKDFLTLKVCKNDTVTVSALELQEMLKEVESLKRLNESHLSYIEELNVSLNETRKLNSTLALAASTNAKLVRENQDLIDKLELSNSLLEIRRKREEAAKATTPLKISLYA